MISLNKDNAIIIACSMVDNEIRMAMELEKSDIPVVWMDKGLHDDPEKLRSALQEEILKYQDIKLKGPDFFGQGFAKFPVLDFFCFIQFAQVHLFRMLHIANDQRHPPAILPPLFIQ